jgi:hypothetical protein
VKPYAFFASEYPLILSIENHCSRKQQDRMAEHLTNILGDLIFSDKVDRSRNQLPSPEELKRRILIKAKRISANQSVNTSKGLPSPCHFECSFPFTEKGDLENCRRKHSDSIDSVDTVSKKFSDLINYCETVKFRGFEFPRRYWEMSSFEETKAFQCIANFDHYNRRNLSRIYPRRTRVLSSNFDPMPFWLSGCQMVALNYQAKGRPLAFSRAMFRQNGRCGYVLKPKELRGGGEVWTLMDELAHNFYFSQIRKCRKMHLERQRSV